VTKFEVPESDASSTAAILLPSTFTRCTVFTDEAVATALYADIYNLHYFSLTSFVHSTVVKASHSTVPICFR
jgi:hypothetical protein